MSAVRVRPCPIGAAALLLLGACRAGAPAAPPDARPTSAAPAVATVAGAGYAPARDLGRLFHDVQMAGVFEDSKTFVDARPLRPPAEIVALYERARARPGFSLAEFVARHVAPPADPGAGVRTDTTRTMEEHIVALWPALTRAPDAANPRSSLVPLPHAYVVPGGRFREVYYWDSYFTMLGLVESGRTDLVRGMLDNFAHLVRTIGHVPNGNRTYYLGRSQPPYLAAMVGLYATATDTASAHAYLDALEREHAFWTDGADRLTPGTAWRRAVRLPTGERLNRYWDDVPAPRPESYREDEAIGRTLNTSVARRERLYRDLRAAAESGWDFSSRWMRDPGDLRSLETTALAPVDLTALLYHAERTIAALRRHRGADGDTAVATRFDSLAVARRRAIRRTMWDEREGFFLDVRWRSGERATSPPAGRARSSAIRSSAR